MPVNEHVTNHSDTDLFLQVSPVETEPEKSIACLYHCPNHLQLMSSNLIARANHTEIYEGFCAEGMQKVAASKVVLNESDPCYKDTCPIDCIYYRFWCQPQENW